MKKASQSATRIRHSAVAGRFAVTTASEELAVIKRSADYLRSHPAKLKQLAVEMGIHTPAGKLSKAYGG